MKKFIKTITIYFFIIIICVIGINHFYVEKYDIRKEDSTQKFNNIPNNIEICNLGSSHSQYGLNYDMLSQDYTCFNFALSNQSLSYDAVLLNHYKDKLADNAIVFITVSYFSILGIDEVETDNFLSKNMRYYDFLPHNYIKDYDVYSHILRKLPSLTAYHNLPYILLLSAPPLTTVETLWQHSAENICIEENVKKTFHNHFIHQKRDPNGELIFNEKEINAIYEMIQLCHNIGATPIIITTPYLFEYTDYLQQELPNFKDSFYAIMKEISTSTNTPYYDYSCDARFTHSYNLFRDCDHLNINGASYFTDIVKKEILDNFIISH